MKGTWRNLILPSPRRRKFLEIDQAPLRRRITTTVKLDRLFIQHPRGLQDGV